MQTDLFSDPTWLTDPQSKIEKAFAKFHNENPHIFKELRSRAQQLLDAGRKRIGIALLFEVMRWDSLVQVDGAEDFKLNNNYRTLYARLLVHRYPQFQGVFELRARREPKAAA